jgi:3-oxoacyl-[acyl-carrier protein] reductase
MAKKVLITGGNKGIGLACTKMFLEIGYGVIVVARDFSNFNIKKVQTITYDLSDINNIPSLVKEIGDIDILINNSGFMQPHIPYDNYPKEDIENIMNVNLYAPVELITLFSKSMKEKKFGRIVNVASIAGQIGHPDVWYGMSKAAIINATKIFAKTLGEYGIVVNAVAPSPVETDMQATNSKERKAEFKKSVITNRFAEPEEVAKTIFWLATDCPEYINGICIDINNGSYMR